MEFFPLFFLRHTIQQEIILKIFFILKYLLISLVVVIEEIFFEKLNFVRWS
jgi:hypothetical protein